MRVSSGLYRIIVHRNRHFIQSNTTQKFPNRKLVFSSIIRYFCIVDSFVMKRVFKIREIIKILLDQGWYLARYNGTSHRQFKHPTIHRTTTVDGKPSADVSIDNLKSMEKQTGLKFKDFAE